MSNVEVPRPASRVPGPPPSQALLLRGTRHGARIALEARSRHSSFVGAILALTVFAAPAFAATPKVILPGDRVKVTIGPAPVMDGETKLATVKAGTVLTARDVKGKWVAVEVEADGATIRGWVQSLHLNVVEAGPGPKATPETPAKSPSPQPGETKASPTPVAKVQPGPAAETKPSPTPAVKPEPKYPRESPTISSDTLVPAVTGIHQLVAQLKSGAWGERVVAAKALYEMGAETRPAAAALAEAIGRKDNLGEPMVYCLRALGNLGPAGAPAVPALVKILEDPAQWGFESLLGTSAITALGEIGPDAKDALPALVEIGWRAGRAQLGARLAIACIAPSHHRAVEWLVVALQERQILAPRWRAARALGKMGPAARSALPALAEAEKDSDKLVRLMATWARATIEQDLARATPLLRQALKDPDQAVRDRANELLADFQAKE